MGAHRIAAQYEKGECHSSVTGIQRSSSLVSMLFCEANIKYYEMASNTMP